MLLWSKLDDVNSALLCNLPSLFLRWHFWFWWHDQCYQYEVSRIVECLVATPIAICFLTSRPLVPAAKTFFESFAAQGWTALFVPAGTVDAFKTFLQSKWQNPKETLWWKKNIFLALSHTRVFALKIFPPTLSEDQCPAHAFLSSFANLLTLHVTNSSVLDIILWQTSLEDLDVIVTTLTCISVASAVAMVIATIYLPKPLFQLPRWPSAHALQTPQTKIFNISSFNELYKTPGHL